MLDVARAEIVYQRVPYDVAAAADFAVQPDIVMARLPAPCTVTVVRNRAAHLSL